MGKQDGSSLKQAAKAALRKVVRYVYRLLRPFLLPFVFRYRTYLSAIIAEQLDGWRGNVVRDILYEQRALTAGLHQALQATREMLREDVVDASAAIREALAARIDARYAVIGEMTARLERIEMWAAASARRVAVHSNANTVLVRTEVGYVLCADSDHAVLATLIDTGDVERGTRLFIERFIKPGDVFVDVGAHIGLISLAAARAMQGQGKIYAFEPFSQSLQMLERSFWINGFSKILEPRGAAISDRAGTAALFLGASTSHHSLHMLEGIPSETVDVQLVTLDSALPHDQPIGLLKIDAEGSELDIVRGARALLQINPDIGLIVECGPSHLKRVGNSLPDWLKVFVDLGYVYRKIDVVDGAVEEVSLEELSNSESTNLFFAKPGSGAWERVGVYE